jgi:predicted amidohydrolase YtcJ
METRMTTTRLFLALSFAFAAGCRIASTPGPAPMQSTPNEQIFVGGTVFAGSAQEPQKNVAILVRHGRISETGPSAALRATHPTALVVDASGATILPGLTDAHGHLYALGLSLDTVDLVGAPSFEGVIDRVRKRAVAAGNGEWILGRGWDQNRWPGKQFPTAAALDTAVSDHPVWLRRVDGHAGLANSAAMRAARVSAASKDPDGGRILRDLSGNPTGVFIDAAMSLIDAAVPTPSHQLRKARLLAAARKIAANGLTEMHDAGADEDTIAAIRELIDEKVFPIRVYVMLSDFPIRVYVSDNGQSPETGNTQLRDWFRRGPLLDYGGRLTVRSVKLYADGALGSRGAALLEPYSDDPANRGLLISKPEHIEDVARRALAAGFQVNTHAIGDLGVRNAIDAYERAGARPANRFRIEHLQVVSTADLPRLAPLGIIASMQPTHATSDMAWAEARLGPERIKGTYAWRSVLNTGARMALGSDFPVEAVNPFFGIYSAVTRQDQSGNPPGGWRPEERLTLAEAIRGFTSDAAYAAFEEASRGTIEPGKLADFTIVDGDFHAMRQSELFTVRVRMTVVGGEVVYRSVH